MARTVKIACIGLLKRDIHLDLINHYVRQMPFEMEFIELPSSDMHTENMALREAIKKTGPTFWIALDVRGKQISSEGFADMLAPHMRLGFIIGGADGLEDDTRALCSQCISLGAMIWPHKLARVMLVEQVFRAQHIWNNHPYHRG